jgi:phenylpyruvate tautomerase PptA (4-oxalocrotonate tautomerase family)
MPFIHITSLPPQEPVNMPAVLENISQSFSKYLGLEVKFVTATWNFLPPGHYATGGQAAQFQPLNSHPLLVNLVVPGFYRNEQVAKALQATASAIHEVTQIPKTNLFIQAQVAKSGFVFDNGAVVSWN